MKRFFDHWIPAFAGMTKTAIYDQRAYFDQPDHRYPEEDAIHPPLAQRLELEQLERALGKTSGKTIMDFGCGSGRVTFWFLKKGYNVTAVDVSPNSLRDLRRIYARHKKDTWGRLSTATHLPTAGSVHAIVGADILHHINIKEYLPKLYRILKPGGRIAFSEPNAWFFPWYIFIVLRRLPWSIERGIFQMTAASLSRACAAAGFQNIRIIGFPRFTRFRLIVSAQKTTLPPRPSKRIRP